MILGSQNPRWIYFRYRQYDPATGEFTTVDPSGLWMHGQGNGYSSLHGSEWTYSDPYTSDEVAGRLPLRRLLHQRSLPLTPEHNPRAAHGIGELRREAGPPGVRVVAAWFGGRGGGTARWVSR